VAVDSAGKFYVADAENHSVRRAQINRAGQILKIENGF
jgi:hypothetical protein